ncbi:endoribonuclease ZC3H12A-like [Melanaphis sacchari]|uniref:endoribonuclease ZC3H12A-like n=1 Tax=Melanaphis sacchari TaxID=742174 RepID=UPI000DC1378E|nr:endoribonuclease ZC3H12A-like [Melanaphis sacchari]
MDRVQIQNTSLPHCTIFGIFNQATSSNLTNNNGAIDLTLGDITGNRIITRNNFGRVQNDAQIFHQYIPRSPIECITLTDEDSDNNTMHQHFNQSAPTTGQSIQSTGQSLQYIQSPNPSVQPAGQSLEYIQHNQARVNFTHLEPTYFPRLTSPTTTPITLGERRPIIIDGLNIGYAHGCNKKFSARGIYLCVQYFLKLGFKTIRTLLPHHRKGAPGSETNSEINWLLEAGYIFFTPSRKIQNLRLTCYSDRIILDHAYNCGGVVVSNDNFRDLYEESEKYKEVIENRHIMIMFINDEIIVPSDQYSRRYPHLYLSKILHFPS